MKIKLFSLIIGLGFSGFIYAISSPTNISPTNGSVGQPVILTFDWSNVTGSIGYIYQIDIDPDFDSPELIDGSTVSSQVIVGDLDFGTTYYWRVAAESSVETSLWSATWSITTSSMVTNISPTNLSTMQPAAVTLDWSGIDGNTGYIYEYDTVASFDSPIFVSGTTITNSSQIYIGNLRFGQTYYWRVAATSAVDISSWSSTWSFTTADFVYNVSPSNNATMQPAAVTLDWSSIDGNTGYIYEYDTVASFDSPIFVSGTTVTNSSQIYIGNLRFGQKYYWRVAATSAVDISSWSSTWSFTTADFVYNVAPSNNATMQPVNVTLDWSSIDGNTGYIYEYDTVASFDSPIFVSGTTVTNSSQIYIGNLRFGQTYYWRVAATSAVDISSWSSTWSFTTADFVYNVSPSNNATMQPVNVTLDWSGIDGNTGYIYEYDTVSSFNSPSFVTGITVTNSSQIYIGNLRFGQTYYWRVAATSAVDISSWSNIWSFTTADFVYNVSPSNNATSQPVGLTIDWSGIDGNTGYIYQYDTVAGYDSPSFVTGTTTANSSEIYIPSLRFGQTYYWRVAAKNAVDTSQWTSTWVFTTGDFVTNYTPTNGVSGVSINPTLDWSSFTGATGYLCRVDTSLNFNSAELRTFSVATSQTNVSGLLYGCVYYWQAAAINLVDTSSWNSAWSFTTAYEITSAPLLVSPANSSTDLSYISIGIEWGSIAAASSYQYQVSTSSTFTSLINVGTTSLVTSNISGLYPHTTYYWRVRASNANGYSPWSTVWSFTTESADLVPPVLVSPSNNETGVPFDNVVLDWNSVFGASAYIFEITEDENFISGITTQQVTETYKSIIGLSEATQYFWRVKSTDGAVVSDWSGIWNFTTEIDALDAPTLASPINNAAGIDFNSVILDWNFVANATSYICQYSTDNTFSTGVISETIFVTNKTIDGLEPNTQYFWRVMASNGSIDSDWSEVWNFTTEIDALDAPTLASPINNATGIDFNSVLLDWNFVANANSYICEYSTDNTFSTGVVSETVFVTNKTINGLEPNAQYFWRVMASNGDIDSDWSEVWDFTTQYQIIYYTLTVNVEGDGVVYVNGEQYVAPLEVDAGAVLTLLADSPLPWPFEQWLGDLTGNNNPETIVMDSDKEITAEFIFVNIDNIDSNSNIFSIYPNPASGELFIDGDNVIFVNIYSVDGRLVKSFENIAAQCKIDISELKSGIYFVEVNNSQSEKFKLIKN